MTVLDPEAPANYGPADAVIRRGQEASGFTGCKGGADGNAFQDVMPGAQLRDGA